MDNNIRVGLIGVGRIGRVHAANLVHHIQNAQLVAVADPYIEMAESYLHDLGVTALYKDFKTMLNRHDIDAVFICSSTETHADLICACAEAGKHIFCEKPIDFSIERTEHVLSTVRACNVTLQIGFNRRFDVTFSRLRSAFQAGHIGALETVRIVSRDPEPPPLAYLKISGGIFVDMAIHDFDMARFVSNDEIVSVNAYGAVLVNSAFASVPDVDTAVTVLRFKKGALGIIENSRRAVYGYDQRIELFGEKGMLQADNMPIDTTKLVTAERTSTAKPLWFFLERYQQAYVDEVRSFITAILEGTPIAVSGYDGLISLRIARAAQQSLIEKREVSLVENAH